MKKASKSSRGGGSSYTFSADDSHNNSIYQIRTNHQRKSIPYKTSNSDDSQPSIVWVNPDNKPHHESYRDSGDFVNVPPNTRTGSYEMRGSEYKKSPASTVITNKSNPQEVRMVLQARGSPPVELAAKILSKGEQNERASQKRSVSGSVKSHREFSTTSAKDSFQSKLRSASVVSSRASDRLSIKEGGNFSQASDDSYEGGGAQWYPREGIVEEENCDQQVVYCPDQGHVQCGYYPDHHHHNRASKRKPRRSCMLPVVCDRSQAQTQTNAELASSKCDARVTNKNCNDSKTCDCCAETPKKYSTIYLCEKHPRDSRTYCCKEVVDRDISPLSNVVYVSPSRISRKSACECARHETPPPPNRRMSCSTCVSQHSRTPPVCIKPSTGEECRCVRRFGPRNPCKDSRCSEEIKKLVTNFFPNLLTLVCVAIKYLLIILLYLLLLWILKIYTAMNHYAHLALLSANLLMLFILIFEPDCLYIYLLNSS